MILRDKLIKMLGGYTPKEMKRSEQRYQALLDSKSDFTCTKVVNEYLRRAFRDLNFYMKNKLYGEDSQTWIDSVWNVIHNNWLRLETRYAKPQSSIPYKVDLTLDSTDAFIKVLKEGGEQDEIDYIIENLVETDNDSYENLR